MIQITFPDKKTREYPEGVTGMEIAKSLSNSLAREVYAIGINGETWDLSRPILSNSEIKLYKWEDDEGRHAFWHSSAHLMAEALEKLYPGIKFGIGPAIENGFYYDVDLGEGRTLTDADLVVVEKTMNDLAATNSVYARKPVSKADALDYFTKKGDQYKIELITDLIDGQITLYSQGQFVDLCRGPHLPDTSPIKAIKLLSIAGAYWRGNEKNKQLTRIYGITFPKQKLLDEYLEMLEQAKLRDHRKL